MNKIEKEKMIDGYGFPIRILNAPIRTVFGEEALDISAGALDRAVLMALVSQRCRWSGAQIRLVRSVLRLTQRDLAEALGLASHAAVAKWEARGDGDPKLGRPTEFSLRCLLQEHIVDTNSAPVMRQPYYNAALREIVNAAERMPEDYATELEAEHILLDDYESHTQDLAEYGSQPIESGYIARTWASDSDPRD